MSDQILARDVPLSRDCSYCGAKRARSGDFHVRARAWCEPDCPKPQGPMPRE